MYHNVTEIEAAIANVAATYPSVAQRIVLPEASFEGRTISALRLGTDAPTAVDGLLFICGQHAREWVPPEVALEFVADMADAYVNNHALSYGGKSYTAAQVRSILDTINVFVVACVNPDGRHYSQNTNPDWRKNRNTSHHATCHGVDLNRNYDFSFDLNKYFLPGITVTSDDPCNGAQLYQGPSPFSEAETRNVRWLLDTYPRINRFIDIHGYIGDIYYPWCNDENQSVDAAMNWRNAAYDHQRGDDGDAYREYITPGDLATHQYMANKLHAGIQPVRGQSYRVTQSFTLYATAGSASDYAWSRHQADWTRPRVEGYTIEHEASAFQPPLAEKDQIVAEVTSGLINFCLAAACGVPGVTASLRTAEVIFNRVPEGRTVSRPVILQVSGCEAASFRVIDGPRRTSGSNRIRYGVAVGTASVPHQPQATTRDLFLWLTCYHGQAGDSSVGTVRVECPETGQAWDVTLRADVVAAPIAGAVLVLDRSGSMAEDGGDGRSRLQVLQDAAPVFVDLAPPSTRVGVVRFATDASPGIGMTVLGPVGADVARDAVRGAIAGHTLATGAASMTSIGDGVFDGHALIAPEAGLAVKALVVLTDGRENRDRYLSDVSGLINDRVFAVGLGTPEQIEPIALDALTHGSGGYLLMTGVMDSNDPYRLEKYYLQILTGVTNDQVVLDPDGWLAYGGKEVIPFELNEADQLVDAIVLTPYPDLIRARLRTPAGQWLDAGHPAVQWSTHRHAGFFRFALPVPGIVGSEGPGRWELWLEWGRKPPPATDKRNTNPAVGRHGVRYTVLVHARSDLEMTTTLAQTARTPGARVTVRACLHQYQSIPVEGAQAQAVIVAPDGGTTRLTLTAQGDGVYQAAFNAPLPGVYRVRVSAQGRTLRGEAFTREAVRTAAVWAGGDRPSPHGKDDDACSKLRCLIDAGALDPHRLKEFGINIEAFGKCCEAGREGEGVMARDTDKPATRVARRSKRAK